LGRCVMLATPNKGSPLAAICGPPLRRCFPANDQLAARPDSFVNSLPEPQGVNGVDARSPLVTTRSLERRLTILRRTLNCT
jgi:hypothetical protein